MSQILIDAVMERSVLSLGITLWLVVVAGAVFWYSPSSSKFPEHGGDSAEALQKVVKRQWSQVRVNRFCRSDF